MQLIHRLKVSQQFDCLFINWKWIFSLCCSFTEGTSTIDINSSEDKTLLSSARNDSLYKVTETKKKWSDEMSFMSTSIPPTEDGNENWRDIGDIESEKDMDEEDKGTLAAEGFKRLGDYYMKDDDNRSNYSDERISKFGTVVSNFNYEMMKNVLYIDFLTVEYLRSEIQGGPSAYQIYVKIFNESGRSLMKWHSPVFKFNKFPPNQQLAYSDMSEKDVQTTAVRIRLYGWARKRRDKLLSESIIGLVNIEFRSTKPYRIKLEKRAHIKLSSKEEIEVKLPQYSENKLKTVKGIPLKSSQESNVSTPKSSSSFNMSPLFTTKYSPFKQNPFNTKEEDNHFNSEVSKKAVIKVEEETGTKAELLVGLAYNAVTGRLTVEIVKGNSFKNPLVRRDEILPSPFVKMTLCSKNSQVIAKSKTTVRYNQGNPLFKEKFMFQVSQFQLAEISIIIGVYHKKSTHRKELIGWSSVGLNNTSDEEKNHWLAMMEYKGELSFQWHLLQPNQKSRRGLPGAD